MLLDDLPPARGLGSWFARQPRELRMRVRQARARLSPFIDQGVQVAGRFCAAALLPRLCDQSDLIVVELRDRSEVAGRVHDDLLAVERRIEVGDDTDAPCPGGGKDERLRRRHVLVTRAERTGGALFLGLFVELRLRGPGALRPGGSSSRTAT